MLKRLTSALLTLRQTLFALNLLFKFLGPSSLFIFIMELLTLGGRCHLQNDES